MPWTEAVVSAALVSTTADALADAPANVVRRVVAFSSTSALTKAGATDPSDRLLSETLREGEQRLRTGTWDETILRPTMIYFGPGDRNIERIVWQLRRLRVFPLVGTATGLRQPVHADDLADAALAALQSDSARRRTYELGGGESLTFKDMIQRVADANAVAARFVTIPLPVARASLRALSVLPRFRGIPVGSLDRMSKDLAFDISAAQQDIGYSPRTFQPPRYS
jgi:nucleoside-diphosphate-sugar epimerase